MSVCDVSECAVLGGRLIRLGRSGVGCFRRICLQFGFTSPFLFLLLLFREVSLPFLKSIIGTGHIEYLLACSKIRKWTKSMRSTSCGCRSDVRNYAWYVSTRPRLCLLWDDPSMPIPIYFRYFIRRSSTATADDLVQPQPDSPIRGIVGRYA